MHPDHDVSSIVGKTVSAVLVSKGLWKEPLCVEFTDGSKLWLEINTDEGCLGHLEYELWSPRQRDQKGA